MTHSEALIAAGEGALLGTLVGDCLGGPYEGARGTSAAEAAERIRRAVDRAPLPYSDDTQLTIAVGEHLLEAPEVDPARLAQGMLAAFEPHRGYGAGMRRLVEEWQRGAPPAEAARTVFPDGSFGNGAAMRVAPVGVRWAGDPGRLEAAAVRSAELTHAHPLGRDGAVVQARAVALAATRGRFGVEEVAALADGTTTPELRAALSGAATLLVDWSGDPGSAVATAARRLGTEVTAQRSVPTAVWAAAAGASPPATLELAVALGGDVDTIAAMAGAIRGAADGPGALPSGWVAACEAAARVAELGRRVGAAAG